MNNILTIDRIIDFYDIPQIFVARDAFDTLYLCLLFRDEPRVQYTAIRVSDKKLDGFIKGHVDLRDMLETPEVDGEYFDVTFDGDAYRIERADFEKISEDRLPERGYVMSNGQTEEVTISLPSSEKGLLYDIVKKFGWACVF